jgi:type I restriction enzyme S subunit
LADEWERTTLGEVCTLQRGFDLPSKDRGNGAVPVVSSSGVSGSHSEARVKAPGVVTGRTGTLGQVFFIKKDFWPLNTTLYIKDFKGNDPLFISYLLKTIDFNAYNDKSTVPGINRNHLHMAEVFRPQLIEQRYIAYVLSSLDDKIELNRQMNGTLEEIAKAIFKSWFVDFDPVNENAEGQDTFDDSELGKIPKGWYVTPLSKVCKKIFSGGTPDTRNPDYWSGNIPWLSSGETVDRFIVATEKKITQQGVSNSSTRLAKAGMTVIASAGQGHTRGQTSLLMIDSYINQSIVALEADTRAISNLYLFFDLARRYDQFRQMSDSHSSRGSLTTKLLAELKIVVPDHNQIRAFDELAVPIVNQIAKNMNESRTLVALRDALLQKLISGEIRVTDPISWGLKQ